MLCSWQQQQSPAAAVVASTFVFLSKWKRAFVLPLAYQLSTFLFPEAKPEFVNSIAKMEDEDQMDASFDDFDDGSDDDSFGGNFRVLSLEEKKACIKKFRQNRDKVREVDLDGNPIPVVVDKMRANVVGQNETLEEVGVNELLTHDAKVLSLTFHKSYDMVKKFNTEFKFDKRDFNKLLGQMVSGAGRIDNAESASPFRPKHLVKISKMCQHIMHAVPTVIPSFLTPENHIRKTIVRRPRQTQSSVATQPKRVDSTNMKNVEDESEKRMRKIHEKLEKLQRRNKSGTPLLQSIIDPTSFGKTVENFFNIAFLARQKRIKIEPDLNLPDDEPIVTALGAQNVDDDEEEGEAAVDTSHKAIQSVLTLDHETFQLLVKNLGITQPAV